MIPKLISLTGPSLMGFYTMGTGYHHHITSASEERTVIRMITSPSWSPSGWEGCGFSSRKISYSYNRRVLAVFHHPSFIFPASTDLWCAELVKDGWMNDRRKEPLRVVVLVACVKDEMRSRGCRQPDNLTTKLTQGIKGQLHGSWRLKDWRLMGFSLHRVAQTFEVATEERERKPSWPLNLQ